MGKLFHSNPAMTDVAAECERCGLVFDAADLNVEAFEVTGELVCTDCAGEALEDHGQFGVGA